MLRGDWRTRSTTCRDRSCFAPEKGFIAPLPGAWRRWPWPTRIFVTEGRFMGEARTFPRSLGCVKGQRS